MKRALMMCGTLTALLTVGVPADDALPAPAGPPPAFLPGAGPEAPGGEGFDAGRGEQRGPRGERGNRGDWGMDRGNRGERGGDRMQRMPGGERGNRPGGMESPVNARAEAEAKIKAQFPEEFAEIEEMRRAADLKLKELAEKAGVEIPRTYAEQIAELKAKYPAEYAEIEALSKTDPRAAFQKSRELAEKEGITLNFGMRGREDRNGPGGLSRDEEDSPRRSNSAQQLRQLRQQYPSEMAEIDALRRSDPAAARDKTMELLRRANPPRPEGR